MPAAYAHRYGDGSGPAVAAARHRPAARAPARARSAAGAGRGLHERPAQDGAGPHLRPARAGAEQRPACSRMPALDQRASTPPAILSAALLQFNPARRARGATWRTTTTSTAPSTISSSIATGSTRAAISPTGADLEEAQLAKKRHLAAKLAIEPGQRVLDIGSGWGGLGLYLAKTAGCDVTGVTLSSRAAQDLAASARAREGLGRARCASSSRTTARSRAGSTASSRSACSSTSASTTTAPSSARCATCSTDDGVAADPHHRPLRAARRHQSVHRQVHLPRRLHSGAVGDGRRPSSARASSSPTSRSCACTTPRRCAPGASASSPTGTRPPPSSTRRFCRMWEFYLAGSETAFRYQDLVVFQIQLAKRIDALPLTRDYIVSRRARAAGARGDRRAAAHGRRVARASATSAIRRAQADFCGAVCIARMSGA